MNLNITYRDTIFRRYYNNPENTLEIYNAINKSNYDPDTSIEMNTLENIFYQGVRNDVSFRLDDRFIVFLEYQTSISENMPMRLLFYVSKVYEFSIDKRCCIKRNC